MMIFLCVACVGHYYYYSVLVGINREDHPLYSVQAVCVPHWVFLGHLVSGEEALSSRSSFLPFSLSSSILWQLITSLIVIIHSA